MKISKSIQRRTIVLTVVIALVSLFQAANFGVQLFNSSNLYSENPNHTFLGALDTKYGSMIVADDYQQHSMVVERDSEGQPLVEALPTSVMLFSKHPNYSRPDHYGWRANSIVIYAALFMFLVIVILVGVIFVSAIRGFRTGNIFRHQHTRQLRWLSLAVFIYYVLVENREMFRMMAIKDIYADSVPIELFGYATLRHECLIIPLFLLILAELMAVAARFNEEESMTI